MWVEGEGCTSFATRLKARDGRLITLDYHLEGAALLSTAEINDNAILICAAARGKRPNLLHNVTKGEARTIRHNLATLAKDFNIQDSNKRTR